jgi:hypothetical protein
MSPATRQDVQNIVDVARNRIEQRTVAKQDIVNLTDSLRQLIGLHQQSQQMIKASEYQRLQLTRRAAAVDVRLANLENEIRTLSAIMTRMVEKQQPAVVPTQPQPQVEQRQNEPGMARQYGYGYTPAQ